MAGAGIVLVLGVCALCVLAALPTLLSDRGAEGQWCSEENNPHQVLDLLPDGTAERTMTPPRGGPQTLTLYGTWSEEERSWELTLSVLSTSTRRGTYELDGETIEMTTDGGQRFALLTRAACD